MNDLTVQDKRNLIGHVFLHLQQTSAVMFDRSMWFAPSFKSLIKDDMKNLIEQNPQLRGHEAGMRVPMTIAFGYAQKVFLCTALELSLLHNYINSVSLTEIVFNGELSSLTNLRKWIESRRNVESWTSWIQLSADQKMKSLKELSFSNLSVAQEYYSEIYGEGCFISALSQKGYKDLLSRYQNLQEHRNGILHRGGELRNGSPIESSEAVIDELFMESKKLQKQMMSFLRWCHDWWLLSLTSGPKV